MVASRSIAWHAASTMMPPLTRPIARSSGLASAASTMRSSVPSAARTSRPYAPGSSGRIPATSTAAAFRRRSANRRVRAPVVKSGVSPNSTKRSPTSPWGAKRPARGPSAARTASPVPSGGSCTTLCAGATRLATAFIRGPITTTVAAGASGRSASSRCAIIGRPAIGCMTLGIADFIRVPLPAARMMAAKPDWLIDCSKRDS